MVASYYAHGYREAVGTVRICANVRHRHILGVHQGIVKLYPTGKSLSNMRGWCPPTSLFILAKICRAKARARIK